MSQSDYIKYKKIKNVLSIDNNTQKQPPVFNSSDLLNFREFNLENTIPNTKIVLNRLTPTGKQEVFDMYKTVSSCSSFIDCSNTNLRTNRLPMSSVYFTPIPQPLNINEINNSTILKTACSCALNKSYTNKNSCKCKTQYFGIVR